QISCSHKISQVRFNYLGQFDSEADNALFTNSEHTTGKETCDSNNITTMLDINCMVVGGEFKIDIAFSKNVYKPETIQQLKDSYLNNLAKIIDHTLNEDDIYFIPSDFEVAGITQEDLDSLFS